MTGTLEAKRNLRREKIAQRSVLDANSRHKADKAINAAIMAQGFFMKASLVAGYISDGTEPDLAECLESVLKSGRRVCLPRTSARGEYSFAEVHNLPGDLVVGKYGLMEPGQEARAVDPVELKEALWLVPGVAFDEAGGRLGRGKGVYDRLLIKGCGLAIGIFYECQKTASLPREGHDLSLDMIVTETGAREASSKRKGEALK